MPHKRGPRSYANPWNLTPAEVRILDSLLIHGLAKAVAFEHNISPRTVESHLRLARTKLGARTPFLCYIRWAHYRFTNPLPKEPPPT